MRFDAELTFSDDQAVTATAASTNVIDLGIARELGGGLTVLEVLATVSTTFTAGGSATMTLAIQGSVDNSTWTTILTTGTMAVADLTVGERLVTVKLPGRELGKARNRYLRLNYTVATGPMTAGTIMAGLGLGTEQFEDYPRNFTVTV